MKRELYPASIKAALMHSIDKVSSDVERCVRIPGKDFTRSRKLPLKTMLLMLIGIGGGSLAKELYDWFGYKTDTPTVSAFVQQRDKIKPEALEMIFKEFVSTTVPQKRTNGFRLLAVDGSDLRLPANPTDEFSSIANHQDQKRYNLVHLNAMYDLTSNTYVDIAMQGKKGMNEHKALVSMVDRSNITGKVLVLMDRGYESFNNMAHFQEKQWNYIIRAKESYGIISRLPIPDEAEYDLDITITLTRQQTKETLALLKAYPERYRWIQPHTTFDYIDRKQSNMYDLHFRIVRFPISDGKYEIVYTNLDRDKYPKEKIKELYNLRWGIETSFRNLKYSIGLASIHSKKTDSMLQEVYSRLILYNYTSLITRKVEVPPNKQICFAIAVLVGKQYMKGIITTSRLLEILTKHLSPVRVGRKYKRYLNVISAVAFQYRFA